MSSDKTQLNSVQFFLVNSEHSLRISHKMTLGRTKGDFILEDASLSNTHCEFTPRALNLFVTDLNSTNGVYVNKTKIFPGMETKLESGDKIRIGHQEFTVYDNEVEAKKAHRPSEKKNAHPFLHILTFFGAPKEWATLYTILTMSAITSFIIHLRLENPVPKHLAFLKVLYNEHIMSEGVKMLAIIFLICLIHGAIVVYALKTNYLRFVSGVVFLIAVFYVIPFANGPMWYVKNYIVKRDYTQMKHLEIASINHLKNLIDAEELMTESVSHILPLLPDDEKNVLLADHQKIKKEVQDQEQRIRLNGN